MNQNLNLGYCCINTVLRELGIFTSRTCRLATIKEKGIEYSYKLAHQNLKDLAVILRWNYRHNIFLFRMSSEMFPFATHADYHETYDMEQFRPILQKIGLLAKRYGQTLTFHPSQFNQLTSQRDSVVNNTIRDLEFHAKILDMAMCDQHSVIVIHGGSKTDGIDNSLSRFKKNFNRLDQSTQSRLVLENCELAYSIEELLPMCTEMRIPIIVDTHHHNLNPGTGKKQLSELIQDVLKIWDSRNIIPLFHVSQSRCDVKESDSITKRRAHSDYVNVLPKEILEVTVTRKLNLDVEAKMKEQAVLRLFQIYKRSMI